MSELFVEDSGAGTPVVILHGAPTTPEHLRPLADRLARRFRALLVHLPGYGKSAPLRPYGLDRAHALVEEALASRGVDAAHLIGVSAGGYRAFALACRGSVRARSVVALGALADVAEEESAGLRQYAKMLRDGVDAAPILEELMLSPTARRNPAWRADVRSWARASSAEDLANELEAFASAPDLRPAIARLDVPILLRVGTADLSSPPARSRRVAEAARRATLQEVDGVGHAILCEDFEPTVAAIEAHLDRA